MAQLPLLAVGLFASVPLAALDVLASFLPEMDFVAAQTLRPIPRNIGI